MNPFCFEATYERFENTRAYLDRIGFQGEPTVTLECLNQLIRCHHLTVPFENINLYDLDRPILLDQEALYHKVVEERRGGYCFELNGAFLGLLRGLGFDAYPCACRGTRGGTVLGQVRHRGSIVILEGQKYFCDVGFGNDMCAAAIPLKENTPVVDGNNTFTFTQINDYWWGYYRKADAIYYEDGTEAEPATNVIEMLIGVTPIPTLDFESPNFACSGPGAGFRQRRWAQIRTEDGKIALKNRDLEITRGKVKQHIVLESREAVREALEKYFGIVCDDEQWAKGADREF